MASSSDVRGSLDLLDFTRQDHVYISHSESRHIRRESGRVRDAVRSKYTRGERINKMEGSLTRKCEKIFIEKLVAEQNQPGGEHLSRHNPVCVDYQFEKGVSFANFSTPFVLLHPTRAVNSEWPLQLGFDAAGSMSDTKIDLIGVTITRPKAPTRIRRSSSQPSARAKPGQLAPTAQSQPEPEVSF